MTDLRMANGRNQMANDECAEGECVNSISQINSNFAFIKDISITASAIRHP